MITDIKSAAESVGITAIITNSTQKIETQLNRITDVDLLPIMLISWDIVTTLEFDENGFLKNPSAAITLLLMNKSDEKTKENMESTAEEMGFLFQKFIKALYDILTKYQKTQGTGIITNVEYTLVPSHGAGKHSGILGKFLMSTGITNC